MKLKIDRPIAFIDIESTGLNREADRIIDLSICKLWPNLSREVTTWRMNPEIEISPASTAIHGITNEMVVDCYKFSDYARIILLELDGCDIGGFNSNSFDVPLLYNEFARCGIFWDYTQFKMIDAGNIFKINETRTLEAAYKFYCDKELKNKHSAKADVLATVEVFLAQTERYDLPKTVDELALYSNYGKPLLDLSGKFSLDENNKIIFNFGPYKGMPADDHHDFVEWMLMKDFPEDTLRICKLILLGNQPAFEEEEEKEEDAWEDDDLFGGDKNF